MAKFLVKGVLDLGNQSRKFQRVFEAATEKRARELTLSYFGSKSGLRRSCVKISEVAAA